MNPTVLGEGREGTVFASKGNPRTCLKVFHKGTSLAQRRKSWARQCQFLRLNQRTRLVPKLYAACADGDLPYIIMERIDAVPSRDTELALFESQRLHPTGGTWRDLLGNGNWALRQDQKGVVFYEGGSLE